MAYCGKCGTKNPDGAKFCGGCGTPLASSPTSNAAPAASQEPQQPQAAQQPSAASQPGTVRMTMHRDGTPPPHRNAVPPRRESAPQQQTEQRQERPPRRQPDYDEPRQKKSSSFGGCLKRLGCGLVVFLVVIIAALWAIGTYYGGDNGGGDSGGSGSRTTSVEGVIPSGYEPTLDKETLKQIAIAREFSVTLEDHQLQFGTYSTEINGHTLGFIIMPYSGDNSKILAKVQTTTDGKESGNTFCTYCGNSIYGLYATEDLSNDNREYVFAHADGKTLSVNLGGHLIDLKLE